MEKEEWKIIAIFFIILFVFGTLLLSWLYVIGKEIIDRENICAYNVCGDDFEIAYSEYFEDEEVCECYDNDMNIIKSKYLGWKKCSGEITKEMN